MTARDRPHAAGEQLQSLTPLRGLAALWVVIYHYAVLYFPALHPEQYSRLFTRGYLAVDMFFLLSGFVMTHVYWREFTEKVRGRYWTFLSARIARLYPLHLFILLLFVAAAIASRAVEYTATGEIRSVPTEGAHSLSALLANLFMLQGLKASELSWNYPAWSISVEFIAYLAFPFALPWIWRARPWFRIALTAVLVVALAWLAYLTNGNFNQWDGPQALLRCLPEFLIGTLLYTAFRSSAWIAWLKRDVAAVSLVAVLLVLLHLGAADPLVVAVFPLLLLAMVANDGYAARLINIAPLVWLGNISYSLYLMQGFVEDATTRLLGAADVGERAALSGRTSLMLMLAMLGACLLAAVCTYSGVERVGRQRLRRLLRRTPRQTTTEQATAA